MAHHFCPKNENCQSSPLFRHYSLNVPLEFFAVGQISKNLKIPTFWQKWQGVSSSFLPKNENFQSSPFSLHYSPNMSLE